MNVFAMLTGLIGGLGLFIYGMNLMGDGLQNVAGERVKVFFEKVTSNPIKGVLTGVVVTGVIQSSSATTVMVVGFVNAGLMTLTQAAGVIMGANIGTTVTGQLVAFNVTAGAPLFVGVGTAIVLFAKKKKTKEIGNIILGFGILFMGMEIMKEAMAPLGQSEAFKSLALSLSHNVFLGIVVGMGMTAIVQSSSATIGILIALSSNGVLPLSAALPILFGDNIGTCVTALLASIGASKNARKAALFHLTFNVIGTVIFAFILVPLTPFVRIITNLTPGDVGRQIANAHTLFNLINTFIQIWFIKYIVAFVNKMIPGSDPYEKMAPKYIDERLLENPTIAINQTIKEVVRMANKAKENLQLSIDAFEKNDLELVSKVYENEKLINILNKSITTYLVKLNNLKLSDKQLNLVGSMFHVVNDIERIGDHAENIIDLTSEKIEKRIQFSDDAAYDIKHLFNYTLDSLTRTIEGFESNDVERSQSVMYIEEKIDNLEEQLRETNIKRLNKGTCNANASAIFLDIINNFERVGDHCTNIAQTVINR
ncbi:Na/Pi cotransporter family protein [Clostridium botulinum]|uniref:Sodium/phosphate cotransporter n=1 Tax=Clostridium botulinum (strain Hall / ATCC 3502 / NCTC 13319 / Type A) TaxID=441771 RepID=A5I7G9_CLOBH|nr:Na/Pi cotransporter family protein [Clostridium botulinum]ABS33493.1 Na/Pi-cotransporter family protein/PhoU family protein [Clostridium botulinum A str. ATCC 19397]ABS38756.1 Na/Pi-cotransporter family protein/PhoU family protein [Clostridium botulinum A str. Hall]APQ97965.1 na+/Pi-cotransporter family protein [Clostridium botulinum]AWB19248.1 Na/Pi cotransporter family protein [Clostridium botulinum]EGT5615547.1 Na/Pi cotransporter family protein [Clostridium botulinum]